MLICQQVEMFAENLAVKTLFHPFFFDIFEIKLLGIVFVNKV
jgi:hypothetical protein